MFKRFTAGFGVGYVLGARAGQKRYEQITELAERALEIPFVSQLVENGRGRALDSGRHIFETLKDRARWQPQASADEDDREEAGEEDYEDDNFEEPEGRGEAPDEEGYEDFEGDEGTEEGEDEGGDQDEGDHQTDDNNTRAARRPAARRSGNGSSRSRSRHGLSAIAAAARERGRVD